MARNNRFSWSAFDLETLQAIALANGYHSNDTSDVQDWLSQKCSRPNEYFVQGIKTTLEQSWLPKYPGTSQIVERLIDAGIGPLGNPKTHAEYVDYIRKCRNSKTLRILLLEALLRYGDQDRQSKEDFIENSENHVPRFAILEPAKQAVDARQPYDYQIEAWNKLSAHLAEAETTGVFQGLLVMPTGAGKTFTSVRWLIQNVVNRGYRLVWLAHRTELLVQAAHEFYTLAGLANQIEKLRVRIVSGIHCSTTQIDPADHVLIASVSSLIRRPDLIEGLLAEPKTFLVIDEAHHSTAKSYTRLIEYLGKGDRRILGLTATPTRTVERERGTLASLFGHRILYEVPIKTLIERQFLARPLPIRVATHSNVERGITEKDAVHLARFNDLSEDWLERIANIEERNQLIVDHYLKNQQKYGKTLIFAINVVHAALLRERFRDAGIQAEYIASYRLDKQRLSDREIIDRFKDKNSDDAIDVLINVQILTEGVDIPTIQTVFLTRPTVSEILMRQMIGRALRGEKAGGTKEAYIVSFEDHWERFREWQSPLALVPDIISPKPDKEPVDTEPKANQLIEALPWDVIREVAAIISSQGSGFEADVFEAIPHGWYVLSRDQDGEDVYQVIAVYEHQLPSWEALLDYLWELSDEGIESLDITDTFDDFFYDCDYPLPSQHDVRKLLEHLVAGGDFPEYNELSEREICDPYRLANHIIENDLGPKAQSALLEERYTDLARAIYPNLRSFQAAIQDAIYEIEHPEDATRFRRAIPIFNPKPEEMLKSGPHHDLGQLMKEVLERAPMFLEIHSLPIHHPTVEWTKRLVKGWYGQAYWTPEQSNGQGRIRINRLLDSPDVSEDVIQFLLWHEYLHLYFQQGHTQTFRDYERRWKTYRECDRFLDNLNEKFGVQFW